MIEKMKSHIKMHHKCYVEAKEAVDFIREDEQDALKRKHRRLKERKYELVKNIVDGQIFSERTFEGRTLVDYLVNLQNVISKGKQIHIEELVQERRAVLEDGVVIDDYLIYKEGENTNKEEYELRKTFSSHVRGVRSKPQYTYDRLAVVRYAERWWNDYNPQFQSFENNCTNYISQCLFAGGASMSVASDRSRGWWYKNKNWSFSWSVAHALRWYFSGAKEGLQVIEVANPEDLLRGDVICYDFNGDGRWQHTTIVVAKDTDGMPLVNAQSSNSRMRYWAYEDSTAWTTEIKYKFFHILDKDS